MRNDNENPLHPVLRMTQTRTRNILPCSFRFVVAAVVILMCLGAGQVQAEDCTPAFYDPSKPTDGICAAGCPTGATVSCTVQEDKPICSCSSGGRFEVYREQSDGTSGIFTACNSNGAANYQVCPTSSCSRGLAPLKCQAKYYDATGKIDNEKGPIDYCLCAAEDLDFCGYFQLTYKQEYTSLEVGVCVQTCPNEASADDYKCGQAISPNKSSDEAIIVCPCKEQVGDFQNHVLTINRQYDGVGGFFGGTNFTYFTAAICTGKDGPYACQGACDNCDSDEQYSVPHSCIAYKFSTLSNTGELEDDGKKLGSYCTCGAQQEVPPKVITPEMTSGDGGDKVPEKESSNGKGGKGKGKGRSGFPQILSKFYNALKYVKNYFRKNGGQDA